MTGQPTTPSPRAALRQELEATRQAYHRLLAAIPDNAWDRPSANPAWTVRQMMYHIILALRFLPADVAALRLRRTPPVPPRLFNLVNEWYTRFAGSRQTRQSLAAEYDRRHARVMKLLEGIKPQEWMLSARYPNINRNLQGTQTMVDMFHYIAVHFQEHAAGIQLERLSEPLPERPSEHRQLATTPIGRFLFRAPIALYHLGLGWLLGNRFLLLVHTGRKSGLQRRTVLEVTDHDPATGAYYVVSGFGPGSQWFKNVQANPQVTIQVGARRLEATAEVLDPEASAQKLVDYASRHPAAARSLARVLGFDVDGSRERYREIAREHLPFVALHPQRVLRETPGAKQLAAPLLLLAALLVPIVIRLRTRRR